MLRMNIKTTPIILLVAFASTVQAELDFSLGFVNLNWGYDRLFIGGKRLNRGITLDVVINENYHLQPGIIVTRSPNENISLNGNFIFNYSIINYKFVSRLYKDNNIRLQAGVGFITRNEFGYFDDSNDLRLYYLKFPLTMLVNRGPCRLIVAPYFAFLLYYDYDSYYNNSWLDDIDNFDYGVHLELGFNIIPVYVGIYSDIGFIKPNYSIKKQTYNGKGYYNENGDFLNFEIGFNVGVNFL